MRTSSAQSQMLSEMFRRAESMPSMSMARVPSELLVAGGAPQRSVLMVPGLGNDAPRMMKPATVQANAGHRTYIMSQPENGFVPLSVTAEDVRIAIAAIREHDGVDQVDAVGYSRGVPATVLAMGDEQTLRSVRTLQGEGSAFGVNSGGLLLATAGAKVGTVGGAGRLLTQSLTGKAVNAALTGAMQTLARDSSKNSAEVRAVAELLVGSAQMKDVRAHLDGVLAAAPHVNPKLHITLFGGRSGPNAESDGIVPLWSALLSDIDDPRIERHVIDAVHRDIPDHPLLTKLLLQRLAAAD